MNYYVRIEGIHGVFLQMEEMMKKYTYIAGSLGLALIALLILLALRPFNTAHPVITNMSIITDYSDPKFTGSTAVLEEALKTIDAQCDHIFMNKLLWLECIKEDLTEPEFTACWDMYDTHIGLLYLKQKSFTDSIGINVHQFSPIEDPFNLQEIDGVKDDTWPQQLDTLFDINTWRMYHSNPKSKIIVYMNGHGTRRAGHLEFELAGGIRATSFAALLTFFNDQLNIHLLGVQSCYWTTKRIHELMQQYGYDTLNFTILTPLSIEKGLWLDTVHNYLHKKDKASCFFDCCVSFTQCFNNEVTDEIKEMLNNTDTLQLKENKGQRATVMAAGTDQVITV